MTSVAQRINDALEGFSGSIVEQAQMVATIAHEGQTRKNGRTPYITHPEAVVGLLRASGVKSEHTLAAAWLHDVVEDTPVDIDSIRRWFGDDIGATVAQLTSVKPTNTDPVCRHHVKSALLCYEAMKMNSNACLVKLADRLHNVRSMDGCYWSDKIKQAYATESIWLANIAWKRRMFLSGDAYLGEDLYVSICRESEPYAGCASMTVLMEGR